MSGKTLKSHKILPFSASMKMLRENSKVKWKRSTFWKETVFSFETIATFIRFPMAVSSSRFQLRISLTSGRGFCFLNGMDMVVRWWAYGLHRMLEQLEGISEIGLALNPNISHASHRTLFNFFFCMKYSSWASRRNSIHRFDSQLRMTIKQFILNEIANVEASRYRNSRIERLLAVETSVL